MQTFFANFTLQNVSITNSNYLLNFSLHVFAVYFMHNCIAQRNSTVGLIYENCRIAA